MPLLKSRKKLKEEIKELKEYRASIGRGFRGATDSLLERIKRLESESK